MIYLLTKRIGVKSKATLIIFPIIQLRRSPYLSIEYLFF